MNAVTLSTMLRLLHMNFRNAVPLLAFLLVTTALVAQVSLSSDDIAKIREVHRQYEQAWLKNDPDGVRALFTEDSVLLPHHGDPPRVGRKELDAFWFPPNSPAATINQLELRITDLGGDGKIAYVWGTDEVAWTTVQDGKTTKVHNVGTFLNILKKQADGSWKISHHMWDDPVPQTQ
ncbi:MAG TPA: SgcJ/EcaC family oxidoreductase [Terriglobales bacterium]|nr:SgcJ/EcaC family oxidoreductase [Terriglobales bacterium]